MDYEAALAADFDSDSDELVQLEAAEDVEVENGAENGAEQTMPISLAQLLHTSNTSSVGARLSRLDATQTVPVSALTNVRAAIPHIRQELAEYSDKFQSDYLELLADIDNDPELAEYGFLMRLSELPNVISDEIALVHLYAAAHYKVVFPELESLVPSAVDYCKVVLEIGQDLVGIRAHEPQLKTVVSAEKVLSIVMAALQQYQLLFELNEADMASVREACEACVELADFLGEVSAYIALKLAKFAPNVAAIIGPIATSQLLVSVGSLPQLAATPACNIASFGVKDLSSQHKGRSNFIRATGYLYHCPLVKGLPPEIMKQAMRIISAKVVLAARIDVSKASPEGALGQNYLEEVQTKIDKLLTPPERTVVKALPVPKEQKSKKRAGRRFRKMRERTQMSDLRKAQNKMEFGKEEQSVTDTFGEEVGLGMSRQMDISVNRNTDARMSKAMISRLQLQKKDDVETILLAPTETKPTEGKKRLKEDVWAMMKRRREK